MKTLRELIIGKLKEMNEYQPFTSSYRYGRIKDLNGNPLNKNDKIVMDIESLDDENLFDVYNQIHHCFFKQM